jgi:hypothetical protein
LTLSAKQLGHRAKWPKPKNSLGARRRFPAAEGRQIGITGKSSLTISAKPVGVGAAYQQLIQTGERSGLLTRNATTESVSLCARMKTYLRFWNWNRRLAPMGSLRFTLWTVQQTARNCAEQFSILSPGEKCERKKGMVEILSFSF